MSARTQKAMDLERLKFNRPCEPGLKWFAENAKSLKHAWQICPHGGWMFWWLEMSLGGMLDYYDEPKLMKALDDVCRKTGHRFEDLLDTIDDPKIQREAARIIRSHLPKLPHWAGGTK